MKEIIVRDKQKFVELLRWSLETASLGSEDLTKMVEAIHNQLKSKNIKGEDEYLEIFNNTLADFIFEKYEVAVITSNNQVLGRNGDINALLFDATDTKIWIDAKHI